MRLILQLANIRFSAWKIAQFQYVPLKLASENWGPGIKTTIMHLHTEDIILILCMTMV